MSEPQYQCSFCQGTMEPGLLLDTVQGVYIQSSWVAGLPETSMWTGGLKIKGHTKLPVLTYRCTQCGHLELFAPSPDAPENILLRPAQASTTPTEAAQLLRAGDAPDDES